ncbi:MAG: PAS domain S-box protein [Chitinivibrionales bacterium]|nr:PAS domain S-box protein [Chitinivibrionales bacterium]MBD3358356.1 PAS domain S-box protein [Chitinivibrionales bacterium]
MNAAPSHLERVLIFAPTVDDAGVLKDILADAGFCPCICNDIFETCRAIEGIAGTAIIAEEALGSENVELLASTLRRQPEWSDFPIILMLGAGKPVDGAFSLLSKYAHINANILVRPVLTQTLVAAVRSSLRARGSQYRVAEELEARKVANEELRVSRGELERERQLLQTVVDSPTGFLLAYLDRRFRFVRINKAYAEVSGYQPSELIGKNILAVFPNEQVEAIFRRVRGTGVSEDFHDWPLTFSNRSDGAKSYWNWVLTPIKDATGTVAGLVLALTETTERKRNEDLLKEREKRLRLATDAAHLGVFEWEIESDRALWENRRMFEIFGLSPRDDPIGRDFFMAEVIHPEDLERLKGEIAESRRAGHLLRGKYRIRRQNDKQWRWVEYFGQLEYSPKGNPIRLVGVLDDVTDRENAAKALKKHSEELDAANRELEAFSYSVSHDLRAPLNTMRAFSDFLLEDYGEVLDTEGRDYLKRIIRGVDKMQALIDDMLSLSRITRQEMVRRDLDLSDIARSIFTDLHEAEPERKVAIVIQDGMRAVADERLMNIALANLLGNAWKYTGKAADPAIEFGSFKQENETIFFVRDNGAGFPMKQAENLFMPFKRLHPESEFAGTGVGLATVERVISRHGGRIWAKGEVGKGASFYFTLPVD